VQSPNHNAFVARLRASPAFDSARELDELAVRHTDGLELLQAVIADKLAPKEEACRFWADTFNVAFVDPFA